ncbi:MAG: carbohydrate ABC transporter permease [Enterocloster bolteae]
MTVRGQGFYKAVFFLPSVISLWWWDPFFISGFQNPISGPVAPLCYSAFGLALPLLVQGRGGGVIAVLSIISSSWLQVLGYNFIIILAGVSGVSQEVIEAARLDNIPLWKIFRDMVVPMSSATGIYVFITTIVQGLQYVFTPIKVVTQGGPNYASSNLIYMSYHEAFTLYRTGTSSAVSVITMVLFIVLLLLEFRFVEKGVYYEN